MSCEQQHFVGLLRSFPNLEECIFSMTQHMEEVTQQTLGPEDESFSSGTRELDTSWALMIWMRYRAA